MLSEERFEALLNIVNQNGSVTIQELVARLGVSESTVRRDITALAAEKQLIKVHGGALSVKSKRDSTDFEVAQRRIMHTKQKQIIGEYAAKLIEDGDLIYIDAGTTTERLIAAIPEGLKVVFVTNALSHAIILSKKGYDAYVLGGRVKPVTEAVIGSGAVISLGIYNFTKGFFGANGIDGKHGITTPDIGEAAIKTYALTRCKEKYVLADSSKFGTLSTISFAHIDDVTIISETVPPDYDGYDVITAKGGNK